MAGDFSRGQKQIVPHLFTSSYDIWLSRPTCVRGTPELQVQMRSPCAAWLGQLLDRQIRHVRWHHQSVRRLWPERFGAS